MLYPLFSICCVSAIFFLYKAADVNFNMCTVL